MCKSAQTAPSRVAPSSQGSCQGCSRARVYPGAASVPSTGGVLPCLVIMSGTQIGRRLSLFAVVTTHWRTSLRTPYRASINHHHAPSVCDQQTQGPDTVLPTALGLSNPSGWVRLLLISILSLTCHKHVVGTEAAMLSTRPPSWILCILHDPEAKTYIGNSVLAHAPRASIGLVLWESSPPVDIGIPRPARMLLVYGQSTRYEVVMVAQFVARHVRLSFCRWPSSASYTTRLAIVTTRLLPRHLDTA